MTEYHLLLLTQAEVPETFQRIGTRNAETKEEAIQSWLDETSLSEVDSKFDTGTGNRAIVVAIADRNFGSTDTDIERGEILD